MGFNGEDLNMKKLIIRKKNSKYIIFWILFFSLNLACQTTAVSNGDAPKEEQNNVFLLGDRRALAPYTDTKGLKAKIQGLRFNVKKNPKNIGFLTALSEHLLAVGDLEGAENYSERALKIDFRELSPKVVLAQVAFLKGHKIKAEAILESIFASKITLSSDILNLAGCIAMTKHDDTLALKYFDRAIEKNQQNAAAMMNIGMINIRRQNLSEAESHFKEAAKILPENPDVLMHLGIVHAMQGELESAQEQYDKIPKSYRNQPIFLFNLALLKKRKGDFDGAIADLKKYLKGSKGQKIHEEVVNGLLADLTRRKASNDEEPLSIELVKKGSPHRTNNHGEESSEFILSGSVGAFQEGK